jgi:hypothetical protein
LQSIGRVVRVHWHVGATGFRIEPGEIEAALTDLPTIREALVIKHQQDGGAAMLVAYITTAQPVANEDFYTSQIIAQLHLQLPAHQVPSRLIILQQMPLTTHGKIDRTKLPAPVQAPEAAADSEKTTPLISADAGGTSRPGIERTIHDTWCAVLNRPAIGAEDNFFDLGGNSLMLLDVHRRLEDVLPLGCQVIDLFRYPTMSSLVQFLRDQDSKIIGLSPTNVDNKVDGASDARIARQLQARKRQPAGRQRRTRSSAA